LFEIKLELEPEKSTPLEIVNKIKEKLEEMFNNNELHGFDLQVPSNQNTLEFQIVVLWNSVHTKGTVPTSP
jgi:hypothetical protein